MKKWLVVLMASALQAEGIDRSVWDHCTVTADEVVLIVASRQYGASKEEVMTYFKDRIDAAPWWEGVIHNVYDMKIAETVEGKAEAMTSVRQDFMTRCLQHNSEL